MKWSYSQLSCQSKLIVTHYDEGWNDDDNGDDYVNVMSIKQGSVKGDSALDSGEILSYLSRNKTIGARW